VIDDSLEVTVVNANGRAIVFVRGEIDLASGQAFRNALSQAQQGAPDVIVDLSDVVFMDSTGINALTEAHRRAPEQGSVRVVSPSPAVRRVFDITGLSELLLLDPQPLTWLQVIYHTSGWRQWTTKQTNKDGRPLAEIIEVGSPGASGHNPVQYALEIDEETTLYESLDEAMRAAEDFGPIGSQTSQA
jgi:stage II sporulation protein AA (anti-sigma F factor antagonist)